MDDYVLNGVSALSNSGFPFFYFVGSLLLTLFVGRLAVRRIMGRQGPLDLKIEAPVGMGKTTWEAIIGETDESRRGTQWLGTLEQVLFFIAIWFWTPEIAAGWLAFKLGSKWEVYHNVVKIPDVISGFDSLDVLKARRQWGARIYLRFLVGTLLNCIAAGIGVGLARLLLQRP